MSATQCERVLALSKRHVGICQAELYDAPDKRGPITRLAARIQDLEDRQHVFEFLHDRKGCRVYRWVEGPVSTEASGVRRDEAREGDSPVFPAGASGASVGSDLRLFEPPVPSALKEAA